MHLLSCIHLLHQLTSHSFLKVKVLLTLTFFYWPTKWIHCNHSLSFSIYIKFSILLALAMMFDSLKKKV